MRRLTVFNNVTVDGYFTSGGGDLSWAKGFVDEEFRQFMAENAQGGGIVLLGRKTYEMMVSYWPTAQARENDPVVAERMNSLPKVVFSRTIAGSRWRNTTVVSDDPAREVRRMKSEDGQDMVVLGSGSIVAQLAGADLVDEYQVVLNPVVLGSGRTMFEGLTGERRLRLISSRIFGNGNVLLCYEPLT